MDQKNLQNDPRVVPLTTHEDHFLWTHNEEVLIVSRSGVNADFSNKEWLSFPEVYVRGGGKK